MTPFNRSLSGVPLFRSLDPAARRALEAACSWIQVTADEWVIDDRADDCDVFFVIGGHLHVVFASAGKATIVRDLRTGEYFGELAAIDLKPRSAGIVAVTHSGLARMPAAVFRGAVHANPDVCDQLLGLLVGQVRMLANRVGEATGLSVRHRLMAELLRLARPAPAPPGPPIVSPPPTHAELAARVASHREAVTRELSALERAGLIARRRGAIVLMDVEGLRRIVDEALKG